jgi:hypothetical protein
MITKMSKKYDEKNFISFSNLKKEWDPAKSRSEQIMGSGSGRGSGTLDPRLNSNDSSHRRSVS